LILRPVKLVGQSQRIYWRLLARFKIETFENEIWALIAAAKSLIAAAECDTNKSLELTRQTMRLLSDRKLTLSHSFALLNQGITLSINGQLTEAIRVCANDHCWRKNPGIGSR